MKKEREYDRVNNEGGEGYNPYRAERAERERQERVSEASKHALTPQGRIDALQRRIRTECGSVAREWGDGEALDKLQHDLLDQIREIEREIEAAFLAEWTRETTIARRTAWNARVSAGEFGKPGSGKVDYRALMAAQGKQGWMLDALKKAIEIYKKQGLI